MRVSVRPPRRLTETHGDPLGIGISNPLQGLRQGGTGLSVMQGTGEVLRRPGGPVSEAGRCQGRGAERAGPCKSQAIGARRCQDGRWKVARWQGPRGDTG
jgi:hypothetical protein